MRSPMNIYSQSYSSKHMVGISEELYILLSAVWTGCVVWSIYTLIRMVRKMIKHKDWIVSAEDFLFWIFASVFVFHQMFLVVNGTIRWYFFIGLVVGGWSVHTIWYMCEKVLRKIKKTLKNKHKNRIIKR